MHEQPMDMGKGAGTDCGRWGGGLHGGEQRGKNWDKCNRITMKKKKEKKEKKKKKKEGGGEGEEEEEKKKDKNYVDSCKFLLSVLSICLLSIA